MVVAWDFDFHQLSRNYSDTTLEQFQAGNILCSHLSCGCYSTHAGKTPENMYTVALPDADCPEFLYFDHHVDKPVILLTRSGQAFDIVARPGYGISTISLPKNVLERFFGNGSKSLLGWLLDVDRGLIAIDSDIANELRNLVKSLRKYANPGADTTGWFDSGQQFESRVLEILARLIPPEERIKQDLYAAARHRLLKQALDYMGDKKYESLNVKDLAAAVNTSERTLERAFNHEYGISPKKYLLGERMYGVHRQLWQSSPAETGVGQVANAWGFWHMGQLAKDYHRLFGELPSETLNRPCMTRNSSGL